MPCLQLFHKLFLDILCDSHIQLMHVSVIKCDLIPNLGEYMPDRTGQRLDNYQLKRLLGKGSFGEVYLAEHVYHKMEVALKVLSPLSDGDLPTFLIDSIHPTACFLPSR